jgi:hypothetical protein
MTTTPAPETSSEKNIPHPTSSRAAYPSPSARRSQTRKARIYWTSGPCFALVCLLVGEVKRLASRHVAFPPACPLQNCRAH